MGGNVFLVPAQRLATAQLLELLRFVKAKLGSHFSGMEITRFFEDKVTHGDLDVVCGLWMGGDGWKGADQEGIVTAGQQPSTLYAEIGQEEGREWTREEVKAFAEMLAIKLGATKWKKHGREISFAIPCAAVDEKTSERDPEDFYQVDLLLVRPPSLRFAVMSQSYGVSALLLSAALRRMSSSFTIHTDRFVVRYSPYHGLKAVEVDLTDDPDHFMAWAGLDPVRWQQGFKTERDFWRWIACLPDDIDSLSLSDQMSKKEEVFAKRFAQGFKKLARQRPGQSDGVKMPKGHSKARVEVMERFRNYIKSTLYADTPVPEPVDDGTADKLAGQASQLSIATGSPSDTRPPLLDPQKPRALSDRAQDALKYFDKVNDWQDLLAQRMMGATELAERQQRRVVNRALSEGTVVSTSTVTRTDTSHGIIVVHEKVDRLTPSALVLDEAVML